MLSLYAGPSTLRAAPAALRCTAVAFSGRPLSTTAGRADHRGSKPFGLLASGPQRRPTSGDQAPFGDRGNRGDGESRGDRARSWDEMRGGWSERRDRGGSGGRGRGDRAAGQTSRPRFGLRDTAFAGGRDDGDFHGAGRDPVGRPWARTGDFVKRGDETARFSRVRHQASASTSEIEQFGDRYKRDDSLSRIDTPFARVAGTDASASQHAPTVQDGRAADRRQSTDGSGAFGSPRQTLKAGAGERAPRLSAAADGPLDGLASSTSASATSAASASRAAAPDTTHWRPARKLAYPTMAAMRAAHAADPATWTYAALGHKFGVSFEAAKRICKADGRWRSGAGGAGAGAADAAGPPGEQAGEAARGVADGKWARQRWGQ